MARDDYELRKNADGYSDPTAYQALKNIDKPDHKFNKILKTFFDICELAGYDVVSGITLQDKETGRIRRWPNVKRKS